MTRDEIIAQRESETYRIEHRSWFMIPYCIIRKADNEFIVNVTTERQAVNILLQRAGHEMLARREKLPERATVEVGRVVAKVADEIMDNITWAVNQLRNVECR